MHAKSLQSCPTLSNPVDSSAPGSSIHGILQAKILEWVAISSSRGSSWPRGPTHIILCFPHWQASSLPPAPSRKHWMPSKTFPQASGAPHPQNPPTGRGHPNIPCSSPTHPSSLLSVQLPSGSKRELWPKASEQAKKASPKLQARKRQQAWTTAPPWEKQNGGCQHTSWCSVGLRRNTCLRILPR